MLFMDKTKTIGQKWLVNDLNFSFWALKRCTKFQSNPKILSRIIRVYRRRKNRQTLVKAVFFTQGVSKRKDLMKIPKVIFHVKPIPLHMMRMYKCMTKAYCNVFIFH